MLIRSLLFTLGIAVHSITVSAETHTITQSGLTFSPNSLTIAIGDTVEWQWTGGSHTVTNGASSSANDAGAMFDAPLNSNDSQFSFTFNQTGEFPYFCRPHEFADMRGTITVEQGFDPENVYVDSAFSGTEDGTESNPFNTIAEAVANPAATLHIAPWSYSETFAGASAITESLTLQVNGSGTVLIGATVPASGFQTRTLPIRALSNE